MSCVVILYCLLIFVYFYCKHTFIFLQGVLCIFFHISIICFDIFFPFSHFSALFGLEKWFKIVDSYLIIQDVMVWCLIMYEWSRVYIFCRCGRGSETAYTFHLMTTFHNTLGEGFHFLFYFKIFYSFYIFIMICFLISIIALNFNHSFSSSFTLS